MAAASPKGLDARVAVKPARPDMPVVDSRKAVAAAKKSASAASVVGFGCPAVDWPHHLRVVDSRGSERGYPPGRGFRHPRSFGRTHRRVGALCDFPVAMETRWRSREAGSQRPTAREGIAGRPNWQSGANR